VKRSLCILPLVIATNPAWGQITSLTDATTPPAIQAGQPVGSYVLSGFETVNLYSGHLNFTLPLLKVIGRGTAGFTMKLPIERTWIIENHQNGNQPVYVAFSTPGPDGALWGTGFKVKRYTPGRVLARTVADTANGTFDFKAKGCNVVTSTATQVFYTGQTLTRLTFVESDGTEHQLVDTATNGTPANGPPGNCNATPDQTSSRGTTFVSTDSTAMTFIADLPVWDQNYVYSLAHKTPYAVSGWLEFPDGTKYRIGSGGEVDSVQDRNGNYTTICYPTSSGCYYQSGDSFTVTDSIGRRIHVLYADFNSTYADTITYSGYGGAPRTITINWSNLGPSGVTTNQAGLLAGQTLQNAAQLFWGNDDGSSPFQPVVATSVVLPDQTKYSMFYNSYGELARVELPTAGAFEYDYPATMPSCTTMIGNQVYGCTGVQTIPENSLVPTVFRRVMQRRVLSNGSTIDKRTVYTPSYPNNTVVEVDEEGVGGNVLSKTMHYFSGSAANLWPYPLETGVPSSVYPVWSDGEEYETDSIALETTPNTTPKTVQTGFMTYLCPWNSAVCFNPNPMSIVTTLNENGVSVSSAVMHLYDQYSNPIETYEYNFGAGPVPAIPAQQPQITSACTTFSNFTRCTHQEYNAGYDQPSTNANLTAGTPSQNNHIRNIPTTKQVFDGNGHMAARTDYAYDQSNLQDDSGIVFHLSGYDTTFKTGRGNLTDANRYTASGTSIDYKTEFDIAGNPWKSYDGIQRPTTLTYSSPDFGFVTQACKNVTNTNLGGSPTTNNRCFYQTYDYTRVSDTTGSYGKGNGQLTSRSDLNSVYTAFTYNDPLDRVDTATRASGTGAKNQTRFTYTNSNTTITTYRDKDTYKDGALISLKQLDGLGRETQSQQSEDGGNTNYITVKRTYDALGRTYQVSNPYRPLVDTAIYTTTLYDSLSRTSSVTTPDGSLSGYSYAANQTTVTDPAAKSLETVTDALGRLTDVYEGPAGQTLHTAYTYNALDSLTNVHQAGAPGDNSLPDRAFTYDWMQRLVTASNPESGTTCYGASSGGVCTSNYDNDGNLQQKTDANQTVTTMTFDELDRMVTKSYSNASPPSTYVAAPAATYTYDDANVPFSIGRLTAISNGNVWQIYGFDQLGRPTASAETAGGGTYTFPTYQYNLTDQLTSVTYPSGRVIRTTYDAAGRINAVNGVAPSNGPTTTYASVSEDFVNHIFGYAAHGAVQQMMLGALTEQTCYNIRLQPVVVRLGAGTVNCASPTTPSTDVLNLAYNYALNGDATKNNGNLQSQTSTRSGAALSQSYTYDGLNRLYTASEGSNWCQVYGYDGYGNRAVLPSVANVCTSWTPNPYGTATATTQFTNNRWSGANYDAAGNQTALTSRTYWNDSENRMSWASGPNIGWTAYGYDGEGRRVTKLVCPSGVTQAQCTASLNGANLTVYAYDAHGKLAAEYGPQADVGTRYLMSDHLGSTRVVVDGTGAAQQCNDYLPFGEDIPAGKGGRSNCFPNGNYPETGPDKANQKFTGKERDWETGLDYFGARYFSAAQGRFTTADWSAVPQATPYANLVDPQTLNLYTYVRNNPLSKRDLDGHVCADGDACSNVKLEAKVTQQPKYINKALKELVLTPPDSANADKRVVGEQGQIQFTMTVSGKPPSADTFVTEDNKSTTTVNDKVQPERNAEGFEFPDAKGQYTDNVGIIGVVTDANAKNATENYFTSNAITMTDEQTQRFQIGDTTCAATSTRTVTNVDKDGKITNYTLTTTQPVVKQDEVKKDK
jgi:RHS repeat-associated protein